jgi:hypothetical protein
MIHEQMLRQARLDVAGRHHGLWRNGYISRLPGFRKVITTLYWNTTYASAARIHCTPGIGLAFETSVYLALVQAGSACISFGAQGI